jgi:uncharacterized protein
MTGRPDRVSSTLLGIVRAALAALEASRERIDNLNVYPVPDGDTGTNMVLTLRAAAAAAGPDEIVRAALMGARGNSGVILSQLVRGAVEALPDEKAVDTVALAHALRAASDAGYAALRDPQEGTMLTVARELAERAEELAAEGVPPEEALAQLVVHGEEALARTPDQLPLLREAGVVDAGGAGLVEIVRGVAAYVRGEPLPAAPAPAEALPPQAIHRELSRYRFCTSFFLEGDGVEPEGLETELERLGDSILVVGAPGAVKAHVHTDEPDRALALARARGSVAEVAVQDMHEQTVQRTERLRTRSGVVAVAAGAGNARLFAANPGHVHVVSGGQSMNPATSELCDAIAAVPAEEVILLPNNENVILAAEQAAKEADKRVWVVSTTSMQAGLSAAVAYDPDRSGDENSREMAEAAAAVRAGAVTRASRTTALGGVTVEEGEFVGFVEGEAVASGPVLDVVARAVVERLLTEQTSLLTVLLGDDVAEAEELRTQVEAAHPAVEIEVHHGGQPHYPLLFSAE